MVAELSKHLIFLEYVDIITINLYVMFTTCQITNPQVYRDGRSRVSVFRKAMKLENDRARLCLFRFFG